MKYIFFILITSFSVCCAINCFEAQPYKLPCESELQKRFIAADLHDYLDECPDILELAGETVHLLGHLEIQIADSLERFTRTKSASTDVYESYNKKITGIFLKDAPELLARYRMVPPTNRHSRFSDYSPTKVVRFNGKHEELV